MILSQEEKKEAVFAKKTTLKCKYGRGERTNGPIKLIN